MKKVLALWTILVVGCGSADTVDDIGVPPGCERTPTGLRCWEKFDAGHVDSAVTIDARNDGGVDVNKD